jgi:NAD(P)-dependent dehydrogenase (short-subunit alcohol dehydrogenase family)
MRTAIVTGATKGIGRAIVDALTADGWRLGLIARNREDLVQLVSETDCGHVAFVGSVTDSAFIDDAVNQMVAEFGHLDAMIANAGVGTFAPIEQTSDAAFAEMMSTNVTGMFNCVRAAVRVMKPRGEGMIVPMLSIAAKQSFPMSSAYVASKWAAYGMVQCVAKEVRKDGIRISSIFPGSVATPFWDSMGGAPWDTADMLQADDVALAVLQAVNTPESCVIDELVLMPPKGIL